MYNLILLDTSENYDDARLVENVHNNPAFRVPTIGEHFIINDTCYVVIDVQWKLSPMHAPNATVVAKEN